MRSALSCGASFNRPRYSSSFIWNQCFQLLYLTLLLMRLQVLCLCCCKWLKTQKVIFPTYTKTCKQREELSKVELQTAIRRWDRIYLVLQISSTWNPSLSYFLIHAVTFWGEGGTSEERMLKCFPFNMSQMLFILWAEEMRVSCWLQLLIWYWQCLRDKFISIKGRWNWERTCRGYELPLFSKSLITKIWSFFNEQFCYLDLITKLPRSKIFLSRIKKKMYVNNLAPGLLKCHK